MLMPWRVQATSIETAQVVATAAVTQGMGICESVPGRLPWVEALRLFAGSPIRSHDRLPLRFPCPAHTADVESAAAVDTRVPACRPQPERSEDTKTRFLYDKTTAYRSIPRALMLRWQSLATRYITGSRAGDPQAVLKTIIGLRDAVR